MGRTNIYIRKENEAAWEAIADKSAWVNQNIDKIKPNTLQQPVVLERSLEPNEALNAVLESVVEPLWRNKSKGKL